MKRLALLASACVMYAGAAWSVAPGFYDGFGPQQAYNWTCPPPQAGATAKPASGHVDINVIGGISDPNSAFTNDGQLVIGFLPGAFDPAGKTRISVDITPTPNCPKAPGITFVTNVYELTSTAQLVKDSNITMVFSNLEPPPSAIYRADSENGPWSSLGAAPQAQPYTVWTKTHQLGFFAAGYAVASPPPGAKTVGGGGQTLPIIVAVLIAIVVLAGLPLAVLRRRRGAGEQQEEEE